MASPVIQSGDYLLEMGLGFQADAFELNDAVKGVLNNTTYVLDGTTAYGDITPYVTNIAYSRGREKTDFQFGAGTLQFTMLDETGVLGPYDTTSVFYDTANGVPGLAPLRPIRLSRQGEYLFVGVVTSYYYQFQMAGPNYVNVQCADEFYKLAQTQLDAYNPTAETSGQRITTVLALPEVDYTGPTTIATGTVNLGHAAAYDVAAGTNTLTYLQQINEAEQGRLFIARDGDLVFQERIGTTLSGPVISFTDDGTGADYIDVQIEFDADNVVNRVYVAALNGNTSTDSDPTSIATYFIQNYAITNSLLHLQAEIDALATYLLEPDPEPRYTSVTAYFANLTNTQRNLCATIDIGDTISVHKFIPGLGSEVAAELAVEGIRAVIDAQRGHTVTYYTSPTTIVYELILNDATYGIIDSTNVLG